MAGEASPRTISGRTSYYQTRLAFHSLPQLIPMDCTTNGFGPPLSFLKASSWPWQARLASGPPPPIIFALLRLGFPVPPRRKRLDKLVKETRWLVLQKARHHRYKYQLWLLVGIMVSDSISSSLPDYFSPFPHGTSSLSVTRLYLALAGSPARFLPTFLDSTVLKKDNKERNLIFTYRTFTVYGLTFQRSSAN